MNTAFTVVGGAVQNRVVNEKLNPVPPSCTPVELATCGCTVTVYVVELFSTCPVSSTALPPARIVHAVGPARGAGLITMFPAVHGLFAPPGTLFTAELNVIRTAVAGLTPVAPFAGDVLVTEKPGAGGGVGLGVGEGLGVTCAVFEVPQAATASMATTSSAATFKPPCRFIELASFRS
jgi:hypothetical protein